MRLLSFYGVPFTKHQSFLVSVSFPWLHNSTVPRVLSRDGRKVNQADNLTEVGKWPEYMAVSDPRYSMCQLALKGLPAYVLHEGRLRHFTIPSHRDVIDKPFCPMTRVPSQLWERSVDERIDVQGVHEVGWLLQPPAHVIELKQTPAVSSPSEI
ncbi:hypothetical protein MLD38_026889 [Melastoma candidum]|uniref:Uncharacterized protein n=1 Tax=Melastoma candidum TaxID=119954 RepID=A0ACB9P6B1_9MYRT|nr:hypothetical protein MLD38_026889 [Melastoma candidum]